MKKTIKKATSIIIAATVGVLSLSAAVPAYAAEERLVINVETDSPSEYGYQNYRYVDKNGNEVVFETGEQLFTQSVLPSNYDSRDYGYVTDVKYQGSGGNCWAYSSISMLETSSVINGYETADTADYSEAHLTWFTGKGLAQDTNDLAYGDGYDLEEPFYYGGNWKRAAATLARWSGVADESEFPAYPRNISAMGNYDESDRYNTSAGVVLESAQKLETAEDIKQWITENGSVSAAFHYNDKYYNKNTFAYNCPEKYSISHMIVIVGWDDNYSAENFNDVPSADGAWICKNSWGTNWGDDGYFMISYNDASFSYIAGFTARTTENCYKNYTYNGSEWNSAVGAYGSMQAANVFTSGGYETLDAVGVSTAGAGNRVIITVYKNLPDGYTTPVEGTLASTKELLIDREGYHTVYLDDEVSLEPGERFSVVVEYKNTLQSATFVPVEKNTVEYQSYSSRAGESYLNYNPKRVTSWETAAENEVHNVYVQAFTKCNHQNVSRTDGAICTEDGIETVYCSQCGKVESEHTVYHTGHGFGGWSAFEKNSDGEEISTRVCLRCGLEETKTRSDVNVVPLNSFFDMFISRFLVVFRALFSK